jgi:TonB family protein
MIDFGIQSDGSVEDAVVLESEPPFLFDAAVLDAVRTWRYEPTSKALPVRGLVKHVFEIAPNS